MPATRSEILAHRGYWLAAPQKNSPESFKRAFAGGFGVETDFRDAAAALVIAHDPPMNHGQMRAADVFSLYANADNCSGWLALNIKADGLQAMLKLEIEAHHIRNYFVFDMSVPDALGYVRYGLTLATRHSEVEPQPTLYEQAAWVWLDCFYSEWYDERTIESHLRAGKGVCLVSPELHKRDHRPEWDRIRKWKCCRDERFLICTDFPADAKEFFGVKD